MTNTRYRIVLGITGCIAAYKSCEILRLLQKRGADVFVIMTPHACEFIGEQSLRALSGHEVIVEEFHHTHSAIPHIEGVRDADLFLVAPCSAHVLAQASHGMADTALAASLLACTAPIALAPSMNVHMFQNAATQTNIQTLQQRGIHIIQPEKGYLACGDMGAGRLAEPQDIVDRAFEIITKSKQSRIQDLNDMRILITAGPTQEALDPVRYISNHSSGKMGIALAQAALDRGAQVDLVAGPMQLDPPLGANHHPITTANEMLNKSVSLLNRCDMAIFAAAVADMRPVTVSEHKLKKGVDSLSYIQLVENPDILAECSKRADPHTAIIGFAAETTQLIEHAQEKLQRKGADLLVANDVSNGKIFGQSQTQVSLVSLDEVIELEAMSKAELADIILTKALEIRQEKVLAKCTKPALL